ILTFIMLLFDPNVMANGRYVTTDLGGTLFLFLATLLLWRMWQSDRWDWQAWAWASVGMGLAFGSKLSTLVFVPIWAVLALLPIYQSQNFDLSFLRRQESTSLKAWIPAFAGMAVSGFNKILLRAALRRFVQLMTAGLFSIVVVWGIFGFEWRAFRFASDNLVGLNASSGPMPTFWAGIEKILLLSGGGRGAYLLGEFSVEGFATYFPIALLAKTPLPTLLGLLLAIGALFWQKSTRRRALFVLLPALLYFGVTLQSNLNIGYRHLLPMLPFIYLLIAGLAVNQQKWARFVGMGTAVSIIIVALFIHPHYLSFFNRAVGGPQNGHTLLADSNIDWGQDLLRLQTWMADEGVESVKLGYFGSANPAYYGVVNAPMPGFPRPEYLSMWVLPPFNPAAPGPGVYAISASSLVELPLPGSNVYAWFRQQEPDVRIGYSILIYRVE
ncbi:MAG: phospholipid carrier-dependent glycosyltransferase, partial [Chloroflexi bacterium]|nr:phospholipid carrier-dependent glycosyltransferase [Chloroflexota bacterium]